MIRFNRDFKTLTAILLGTLPISLFVFDFDFIIASDIIVFLSIIIGCQITTVSVLYNSRILNVLHDTVDQEGYGTKLNRLACYYKYSIYTSIFFICILIFVSKDISKIFYIFNFEVVVQKSSFFLPMFASVLYWFIKANRIFFKIFVLPRNE